MKNDFINPYGVQTTRNCDGVLFSYSVDSKNSAELFFNSHDSALKYFKVKSVNEITGLDILANDR